MSLLTENNFAVIIAGSRTYNNYNEAKNYLDKAFSNKKPTSIICGMARGADMLGYRYAKENNIPVLEYPAEWFKYGKSAGYIRNSNMATNADALIAFWDGKSKGTKNMIEIAKKHNMPIRIVFI